MAGTIMGGHGKGGIIGASLCIRGQCDADTPDPGTEGAGKQSGSLAYSGPYMSVADF